MRVFITCLLFLKLLGISAYVSFAQQDQSYQKLVQEMEILKTQFLTLQSQLQTVENVEKIELMAKLADAQAKLADANAKLMNAEFGNFERKLRDSNDDWLIKWIIIYLTLISVVGTVILTVIWNHFKSTIDSLIVGEVGKRVSRFEEAVNEIDVLKDQIKESIDQVNMLEGQIRALEKEHAVSVLERYRDDSVSNEHSHSVKIEELQEEALLDVFRDQTRHPSIIEIAAEILARRQSSQLVSLLLEYLNSILDSYQDEELELDTANHLQCLVILLRDIPTQEACEGLTKFLNRLLLREPTEFKALLLTVTASSFAWVSRELNKTDWVSLLKTSFSYLGNEPETMKGILNYLDETPGESYLEDYLLELLAPDEPEFVTEWREGKESTDTEAGESL